MRHDAGAAGPRADTAQGPLPRAGIRHGRPGAGEFVRGTTGTGDATVRKREIEEFAVAVDPVGAIVLLALTVVEDPDLAGGPAVISNLDVFGRRSPVGAATRPPSRRRVYQRISTP